jgi:hypothetical protein
LPTFAYQLKLLGLTGWCMQLNTACTGPGRRPAYTPAIDEHFSGPTSHDAACVSWHTESRGVFDFLPLGGSAGGPGCGQPWPCSLGQHHLFDSHGSNEPSHIRIVFDLSHA